MIKIMKKEIKIGTLLTTKYKKNLETLQECKRHNNMDVHEKIEKKKKIKNNKKRIRSIAPTINRCPGRTTVRGMDCPDLAPIKSYHSYMY